METAPAFVSGQAFAGSLFDSLLPLMFYNPYVHDLLQHLIFSDELWQCTLPPVMEGATFGETFEYCLKTMGLLTIGVYKHVEWPRIPHIECARSLQSMPKSPEPRHLFVSMACPPSDTRLQGSDRLFVLGRPPRRLSVV
mmetsp:Transcript_35158/g.76063  ORF Transcript_35158/g.76063 Transcript_35158/m.76063 type:complete len:139 (+) Transcript_35158:1-417(+)